MTLDLDRLAFASRLLVERGAPDKYRDPAVPGMMRRMPLV